jgi:hypothetical protein
MDRRHPTTASGSAGPLPVGPLFFDLSPTSAPADCAVDEPIPSLGNQSPRKAAKKGKGREKVIGWLKMLENHSARQGRDDPVGSYDFTWIWKELGLGDERR